MDQVFRMRTTYFIQITNQPLQLKRPLRSKKMVLQKKKLVQSRLWNELGLKVDKVVQGRGTSNTGNVARRFFKNI